MTRRIGILVLAAMLVVGACSDDDTGTSTTPPTTAASAATATTVSDGTTTTAGTTTTTAVDTTTTVAAPVEPYFGGFETVIVQTTPHSGEGVRPLLVWEPVDDADHYAVYLYAPDGAVYWTWRGEAPEVYVGGEIQIREDAPGPSVVEGMTWSVVAFGEDLIPMAASPLRAIAP